MRGRSVFDFFHPDEIPYARSIHSRGILLDKAASLHYVRVLSADGRWISCECCFTVVHDVLVACTSIYRQGQKSERRAIEGAQVRRIFSSSPRDPRYHMLEHLSPKFKMPPVEREPRAALILNRFTRNLTIMFATNAVASVLGLAPDQIKDKSFYRCIQERCLPDALNCLESAKANDSIAYLRFWSRDPREENDFDDAAVEDEDEDMGDGEAASSTSDSEEGGAAVGGQMDVDSRDNSSPEVKKEDEDMGNMRFLPSAPSASGNSSSGQGSSAVGTASSRSGNPAGAYETPVTGPSPPQPAAADGQPPAGRRPRDRRPRERHALPSIELEAVVSCTSDGLVVILRRARPAIPPAHPPQVLPPWEFENGLFAAPWAQQPVRPYVPPEMLYTFRAPLLPQYMPLRENVKAAGGPPIDHLMRSIRDVAVFAWALVGINGNFASFSHGRPGGEAAPPGGLPIWDPTVTGSAYQPPDNQAAARWAAYDRNMMDGKGKGPAVPQSLPDPYYSSALSSSAAAAAYGSAARRHDAPPPPYAMENYAMYGGAPAARPQQPGYDAVDLGYMPPPPRQAHERQQRQHHQSSYPPSGAASQMYQPHSWADGLVGPGRSSGPAAAQDSSAVPASQHQQQQQQPSDQDQTDPSRELERGWRGGPFRG